MNDRINFAIQVLPLRKSREEAFHIIDEAIKSISSSGLKYVVCPFETVVEGAYKEVMTLLDSIQESCRQAGAEELIINMKLQRDFSMGVTIEDKMGKYS